jgi:hypothetical protein
MLLYNYECIKFYYKEQYSGKHLNEFNVQEFGMYANTDCSFFI